MSLNHLHTNLQGLNDKLEIGCYRGVASGEILNFGYRLLQILNTITNRFSMLSCDITAASSGNGIGYSWVWNSAGVLTVNTGINGASTGGQKVFTNCKTDGVTNTMCFMSYFNNNFNGSFTINISKYISINNYALTTCPCTVYIQFY